MRCVGSGFERIENVGTGAGNILDVTSGEDEAMDLGGCRRKAVDDRERVRHVQTALFLRDGEINAEDPVAVVREHPA